MDLFKQFMGLFKPSDDGGVDIPLRKPTPNEETNTMTVNDKIRKTNQLSTHFKLSEFTKSQTASRLQLDNSPTDAHLTCIKTLVDEFLQPLREVIDMPIVITSGYRSDELNYEIGGSATSQHSKGEAVDIECFGMSNKQLAVYIRDHMDFDQLILEFYDPNEGGNSGWVHVSYKKEGNRKEVLSAIKEGKKPLRYVYGITSE